MSVRDHIYGSSPVWLQNVLISAYGRKLDRQRYAAAHEEELRSILRTDLDDKAHVLDLQWRKFRDLLSYLLREVPFYRAWSSDAGLTERDFRSWEDVKRLPIIGKDELRADPERFCAESMLGRRDIFELHTSGTTGTPLTIYCDSRSRQRHYAFWTRLRQWWGIGPREWRATSFGRVICDPDDSQGPFWRYDWPGRNMLLSSYHLSRSNLPHYLRAIEARNPTELVGYASSLYMLAKAQLDERRNIRPRVVFTTADNLLPHYRGVIEDAFGCPVVDQYGCAEMAIFAAELSPENFLVHPEHGFLEVLDREGRDVGAGEVGEAVCTNFVNATMPLVRYRIGDLVTTSSVADPGGTRPTFARVEGRADDVIYTQDRRPLTRLSPIWKVVDGIAETQVIQDRIGEMDVHLVVTEDYRQDAGRENLLLQEIRKRVGTEMVVRLHYEDEIPKDKNGKFRTVVSRV